MDAWIVKKFILAYELEHYIRKKSSKGGLFGIKIWPKPMIVWNADLSEKMAITPFILVAKLNLTS